MTRIYCKLVGSAVLWGGTWVAGRMLGTYMGPFSAAFLRFALASVFLYFLTARIEGRFPRLSKQDLPWLLTLAATGIFAYNALFFAGLRTVPAGRAALIVACIPSVVALFSGLLFREAFPPLKIAGIVVSFAGVGLIVSGGDPLALLATGLSPGDLCIFGCVAAWAAYTLAGKKAMERIAPYSAVTWSCILGALLLLPPALVMGLSRDVAAAGPIAWGLIAFFGILATGFGFSWYYEGVKAIGPTKAGVFINLVPVVAVFLGWLILDEPLSHALALGGLLVLFGVWLTNRRPLAQRG
ncbi:DMT family transporter [Desulfovibrio sp. TomC]|uniref:DMT family transporter n=1 Tax=Desulfovibrio sp. TomC TaxID=1562888 RepID=UPI000575BB2E|nr:DMT family transporter [Desulfovibrio sp. TomC]KHK01759.1 Permease of the drug/metabolite transporter (DMT) superfamily [Desulfovibrio sp. TomC]